MSMVHVNEALRIGPVCPETVEHRMQVVTFQPGNAALAEQIAVQLRRYE